MFHRQSVAMVVMVVAGMAGAAMAQGPLFSDTFSLRQGKRPSGWEAVGAPATPRFWFIEDGRLASGPGQDLGGDGYSYMIIRTAGSSDWADYAISTRFWMESRTGRVVLVGRYGDGRNFYEAGIQIGPEGRSASIDLIKGGRRRVLAHGVSGVGLPPIDTGARDRMQQIELRMVGSALGLYLNGKRLIEATDNTFSKGTAGVGVRYARAWFDDLTVERARVVGPTVAVRKATPSGAGSKQVYRFLMGTFDTEAQARQYRGDLVVNGFINVDIEKADNKWDVLAGAFGTEAEALKERNYLESQHLAVPRIVVRGAGTTQILPVARRRAVAANKAYTLLLSLSGTKQQADDVKRRLELDGFFGAQIRPTPGGFVVALGSFRSRADAERYRKLLEGAKYAVDRIVEEKPTESPGPAVITPREVSLAIQRSPVWQTLTEEQRRQFEQIIKQSGAPTADLSQYYADLKQALNKVRIETRQEIAKVVKETEAQRNKQLQTAMLINEANQAVGAGNYDQARAVLKKILAIDKANPMVAMIQQQIELRERTSAQAIEAHLTKLQQADLVRQIGAARRRAERFQSEGYLQNALLEFEGILDLVERYNLNQPSPDELRGKIATLKQQIVAGRAKVDEHFAALSKRITGVNTRVTQVSGKTDVIRSDQQETAKFLLVLVIGLGVLTILFLWIFFGVRRRNRMLLEQMRSLTLKPMMEISGGAGGAAALSAGEKPAAALGPRERPAALARPEPEPSKPPEPEPPKPPEPEPSSFDIFTPSGTESLATEEAPPEPPAPPPLEEEQSPLDIEEPKRESRMPTAGVEPESDVSLRLPEEPPEPAPTVVGGAEEESPFSMLETAGEEESKAKAPAKLPSMEGVEEEQPETSLSLEGVETPPSEGELSDLDSISVEAESTQPPEGEEPPGVEELSTPPVEPESTPLDLDMVGIETPAEQVSGVFYDQSFDDEVAGSMPKNWEGGEGEYEFANLVVADETPAGDTGRYLRFEKTEGKGSAYYSCKFPDATGQVAIEFDLRCDRKNKFLLGFYVEKDGDFRQSIHTIIHQSDTAGGASLRMQGEAIPYEMGTWRHVKYVANLSRGRLSGFVDGETVLDDIPLTNCPRSLNTLSIRDNVPTTGVLLIDNIRIARG